MESKKTVPLLNYELFVMTVTHTLIHVFARIHPALFPIFRVEFGLTLQQLGLIAAIPSLCSAILYIPSGVLTDKLGSRVILIICFLTSSVAAVAISQSFDPIMLTVSISAVILTSTFYHPASYSYVTKLFSEKERSKALGFQSAGGVFGMALGPISLSLLVGGLGWKWRSLYIFWAFPILAIIVAIWKLKPIQNSESKEEERGKKAEDVEDSHSYNPKTLISVGLIMFLVFVAMKMFGSSMLGTFIPTYLHSVKNLTVSEASLIYGSISLTGVVAAPLGGFLSNRFGNKRWLTFAIAAYAACVLTASTASNVLIFITFYLLSGFFDTSTIAAKSFIVTKLTPSEQWGMGFALFFLSGSLVSAFAPIAGASIAGVFGLSILFPICVVLTLVSLAILKFGVKV